MEYLLYAMLYLYLYLRIKISQQCYVTGTTIISILLMRQRKQTNIEQFAQDPTAGI